MKTLLLAILLIALTTPISSINAQVKRVANPNPYTLTPIDRKSERLPRRYQGVDPEALFEALEKRSKGSGKDEFETTAAYNARILATQAQKLIGQFGSKDLIPVVLASESVLDGIDSKYNADAEELTVKITARAPVIGVQMDLDKRKLGLKYDFHPTVTYVGVNGYGARITVEKYTSHIYSVLVRNFEAYASEPQERYSGSGAIITRLRLSPPVARIIKEHLRALLFVRLQNPLIEKGYVSKKPTVQDPRETFAVYNYLVAEVEQIWLYDYETGEVYKALIPRQSK